MFVERYFDGDDKLLFVDRFYNIAVRPCILCALENSLIRMSRYEHDRDSVFFLNRIGRFDTANLSLQPYIHKHKIGTHIRSHPDGCIAVGCNTDYIVIENLEAAPHIQRNDRLIFNKEYSCFSYQNLLSRAMASL